MPKIIVGPFDKGLRNDVIPVYIDNSSFPTLINAYQWRGRVKRKRGTSLLTRATRPIPTGSIGNSQASPWTINTIFSNYVPPITPETNAQIKLGSVQITIATTPNIVFVDQGDGTLDGFLVGTITNATQTNPCEITSNGHGLSNGNQVTINSVQGMTELNGNTYTITVTGVNTFTLNGVDSTGFSAYTGGGTWTFASSSNFGTINYVTSVIVLTHTAGAGVPAFVSFSYYPNLPAMGFRDLILDPTQFTGNIGFDTKYAYNVLNAFPYSNYSVSFYKNPATGSPATYVQKTNWTPLQWNGEDYQQFWSINYQNAFWATNGINIPFTPTHVGMQYKPILTVTVLTPTTATLQITAHGLSVGDFVFINEVATTTGINFQTGYVINPPIDANNVNVAFPNANIATNGTGGIAQYLTNNSDNTKDCMRWYDGDPTNGLINNPGFLPGKGWVNFCPPLSQFAYSIADLPAAQYYLVTARIIVSYKDRLLFFGPVIQTSAPGSQIYLPDTIIYSQNGTPYYTASFSGDPSLSTTTFTPLLLPLNQTATPTAFWGDQTGFGGWYSLGLDQAICTVGSNEDTLILGLQNSLQARLIYTGNDLLPFNAFIVNSELGSSSTFSAVDMDQGVISRGDRGFIITSQTQAQRFDLPIPDEVFQIKLLNNGAERVCAQRDFINEWIYFTYPYKSINNRFPTQTLMFNYRDKSWAVFRETYTCYGQFRRQTGFTWQTVGLIYKTWSAWNDPWNAGESNLLQPDVVGGNTQGFFIIRDEGTSEATSLYIKSFSGNIVTSPDHCLTNGDYIVISDCLGDVGAQVNGKIFSVFQCTQNTFQLNPPISAGSYIGGGLITRLYKPYIQTKQFPTAWEMARKTRLGPQQYLFTTTQNAQIQLLIFLSQNANSAYNLGGIVPSTNTVNNSLIYSTVLYTCPESTNLGLTPANINLQMVTAEQQAQIWHRMNTSLQGDTVQIGFTLSDEQMRDETLTNQYAEIELHGFILDVTPGPLLA